MTAPPSSMTWRYWPPAEAIGTTSSGSWDSPTDTPAPAGATGTDWAPITPDSEHGWNRTWDLHMASVDGWRPEPMRAREWRRACRRYAVRNGGTPLWAAIELRRYHEAFRERYGFGLRRFTFEEGDSGALVQGG